MEIGVEIEMMEVVFEGGVVDAVIVNVTGIIFSVPAALVIVIDSI